MLLLQVAWLFTKLFTTLLINELDDCVRFWFGVKVVIGSLSELGDVFALFDADLDKLTAESIDDIDEDEEDDDDDDEEEEDVDDEFSFCNKEM